MTDRSKRRYEPDRRERIVEVTLDVIAAHGVAGTTHRRVAEAADVPLGSMTYHFKGIDDLLVAAFTRLSQLVAGRYREALEAATTLDEARAAVVELICGGLWASQRNMVLSYELYAYATRNPRLKPVLLEWMDYSHGYLERHFPPATARVLDAFIEGVTIHNTASSNLISPAEVRAVVEKLTA
ncbi:MAG: TetR family transcriptional regulator [Comamonas sp.]